MDEPTNHLDFDTVLALAEALSQFKGTLVVVSHDRSFINKVANKVIEIRDGFVEIYPGSYEDYLWSLEKGALKERFAANDQILQAQATKPETKESKFNYKEAQKKLSSEVKELQRKILKAEEIIQKLAQELEGLNNELLQASGQKAQQIAIESAKISQKIAETEETLLIHMENLDTKEKELKQLTT